MDIYQMTKEMLAKRINWGVIESNELDWEGWLDPHGDYKMGDYYESDKDCLELWDYSKIGALFVLIDEKYRCLVKSDIEDNFGRWLQRYLKWQSVGYDLFGGKFSQEEFDEYFERYYRGWTGGLEEYLNGLFPPEEESNQGGSPTENQPTPDTISLPPELDTKNTRKYLSRAISVGYIKSTDNGGYEWVFGEKYRGRGARLGYFVSKVYDKPRPITPLESLFGVKNLSANVCQAETPANRADVVKWRTEIDRTIFYD